MLLVQLWSFISWKPPLFRRLHLIDTMVRGWQELSSTAHTPKRRGWNLLFIHIDSFGFYLE